MPQTSTQDPTSDKSQGGPDPRSPPLDPRMQLVWLNRFTGGIQAFPTTAKDV